MRNKRVPFPGANHAGAGRVECFRGCEIFGGDFELKALLQWIAASAVGRPLHLTLFGDKTKAAVGKVLDEFRERFKTVKDLYDAIQMAKHTRKEYGGLWKAMQKP